MKARLRTKRSKLVAAGSALLMVAGAGAAYAYWSGLGGGSGSETNSAGAAAMVVHQDTISGLVPGGTVALSGYITNPGATAPVGSVMPTIGTVNFGQSSEYWVTGTAIVNASVPSGGSVPWTGLTLHYANLNSNQDTGKGATVNINYALTGLNSTIVGKSAVARVSTEQSPCNAVALEGTTWANSSSMRNYALTETTPGTYLVTVDYTGGTFSTVAGPQPGNCAGMNAAGITGTMDQTWSATINTALPANHTPDCSGTVQYGPNECIGISGFLKAVFGDTGAALQPSMANYTWHDTFTANGGHGTWYDVSAPGTGAPAWPAGNSGNIQ
jgi:hypothetical protein